MSLTDEQLQQAIIDGVKAGKISWLGYKKDDEGRFTIPVISKSDMQLSRAIEAALERELEAVRKDAERWAHACKGNNKHINVCSWDNDAYEFVGYAMKKQSIDAIADAEISAIDAAKESQ
jgi:hypothetical protein